MNCVPIATFGDDDSRNPATEAYLHVFLSMISSPQQVWQHLKGFLRRRGAPTDVRLKRIHVRLCLFQKRPILHSEGELFEVLGKNQAHAIPIRYKITMR